jgi:hypothetical protein
VNDLLPKDISTYVLGALLSLCLWIARGFSRDIKKIEGSYVTRKEVVELIAAADARALEYDRRQNDQHRANTDNFREVRLQLESVNNKLFELAKVKQP